MKTATKKVTTSTTRTNTQNPLITLLNQSLATAIDLKLQAKQAHWNIKGNNFIALHELFDQVATAADAYVDLLAERVVQLGGTAEGALQTVATTSTLKSYPTDIKDSQQHAAALATAIHIAAQQTNKLVEKATTLNDAVTADICTEVTRGLDKWHWFVASHL